MLHSFLVNSFNVIYMIMTLSLYADFRLYVKYSPKTIQFNKKKKQSDHIRSVKNQAVKDCRAHRATMLLEQVRRETAHSARLQMTGKLTSLRGFIVFHLDVIVRFTQMRITIV